MQQRVQSRIEPQPCFFNVSTVFFKCTKLTHAAKYYRS